MVIELKLKLLLFLISKKEKRNIEKRRVHAVFCCFRRIKEESLKNKIKTFYCLYVPYLFFAKFN